MRKANVVRPLNGGVQRLYRFANGRGASVIRHLGSYGVTRGLWELAVLKDVSESCGSYALDYTTEITSDVKGHLREDEVQKLLDRIEALPKIEQ